MSRQPHAFPRCPDSDKVRFGEHKDATQALSAARRAAANAAASGLLSCRRELRSFLCPACRGWHLTSQGSSPMERRAPGHGPSSVVAGGL